MFKRIRIVGLLVLLSFVLFLDRGQAEEVENNVQFSVGAVLPDNQIAKDQAYFDLRMTPGQEETIEIQIKNSATEKSRFSININQAFTNASGFIEYNEHDVEKDSSLKYNIDDIASYEKSVEVDADSTATVPITLKMPKESFDGVIMAGIQVIKDTGDDKQGGITNSVGYILGLRLSETDNEVKRELNLLEVKPAVSFNKTSVVAKLQNPTMDAYGHLKYQVKVTNTKTKDVVKEETFDSDMQMAPNSTYDFAIDWDGKKLAAGNYNLDLVVSDAKGNEWKFNQDFEITKDDADKVNKLTVGEVDNKLNIWLIIAIIVIILLLLIIIWMLIASRRKKKKREQQQQQEQQGPQE